MSTWRREWWVAAICLAGAGYFVFVWTDAARPAVGAFDLYWEYYPNMVYAARQFWHGGAGLLWNPLQSCGQPFFGNSSTALLYPPSWFFLFLPADAALLVVTAINLTIGGGGAYLLGRELGARPTAALCGALAFELGNEAVDTSSWMPLVNAPIMWLPAALWCVERILKQPSLRMGIALAMALSLALLNGFPQPVLFGYQVIVLRVAWEVLTSVIAPAWRARPRADQRHWLRVTFASIALGLILPPLLTALHFFPGAEMAALSVRDRALNLDEILAGGTMTWPDFRHRFGWRGQLFNPVLVGPFLIALASPLHRATRRVAVFYGVIGLTYFLLAFGPVTPLFDIYFAIPLNRTFRGPGRFVWMTGLCLSILTALGAEYLIARRQRGSARLAACWVAAATVGLHLFSPTGLRAIEWLLAGTIIAITLSVGEHAAKRSIAMAVVVAVSLMAFHIPSMPGKDWMVRPAPARKVLSPSSVLSLGTPLFDWLRGNMTPHERVYIMEQMGLLRLTPKSASLFGLRSVHDYEPAPTQRSAAYHVMMRAGQPMDSLNEFYFHQAKELPGRRLLNLAAGKYLLIDGAHPSLAAAKQAYRYRAGARGIALYENTEALPRAFFVPRVVVVPDAQALLERLARGTQRPREVALVESPPPSGFLGAPGPVEAPPVDFIRDDPEHIALRLRAPQRGFVHLADQFFPGWQATVNGEAATILRGNFLFRLVEVPAGDSVVELRYAPDSLRLGGAISLLTIGAVAMLFWRTRATNTRS